MVAHQKVASTGSSVGALCLHSSSPSTATPHPPGWEVPAWEAQPAQSSPAWRKPNIYRKCCLPVPPLKDRAQNYTPCGRRSWNWIELNEWEMTGQQHRDLVQSLLCSSNLSLLTLKMLRISTSEFNLRRFAACNGEPGEFLFTFSYSPEHSVCILEA